MDRLKHLERALDALNQTRRQLYDLTNTLTQEELDEKPSPGEWSVGEIMNHLIKAENEYAGKLRRRILLGDRSVQDNALSQTLRPLVTMAMKHGGTMMKFETDKELEPIHGFPHLYLVRKLAHMRERTFDLAERLGDQFKPINIREPHSGVVFSGEDWLYWIACHEARHIRQIERTLEKVRDARRERERAQRKSAKAEGRVRRPVAQELAG